jgi:hypothetical protein
MGTRRKRVYLSIAAGTVLFLGAALACCTALGTWLAVNDPLPSRLDVLFMFFGENARFSYSRSLMERYPEAHWVLSDNFHRYSRILSREGYDMSRTTSFDSCRYTLSEITALAGWLHDNRKALTGPAPHDSSAQARPHPVRVGLVSSPCHMRRIRCMAGDVIRDTAYECLYLPVPLERYGWTRADLRHWWRNRALRSWVMSETAKILWYWLFH